EGSELTSPEAQAMIDRLKKYGPRSQAGDTMKWVQVDRPHEYGRPTFPFGDKFYALVYTTPEKSMVNGPGIEHWALERAFPATGEYGETIVGFTFDAQGGRYFSDLTR